MLEGREEHGVNFKADIKLLYKTKKQMKASIEEILSSIKRYKHMRHRVIRSRSSQSRGKMVGEPWFKCTHEGLRLRLKPLESVGFGTDQKPLNYRQ